MGFYEELIGVIASSYQASSTWTMVLSTSGTGTATSRLVMYAASATTATLDGSYAHFYTDSAGTLNESQTWSLSTGWNTIYIKVTSGSSNLVFADRSKIYRFGYSDITAHYGWVTQTNSPTISSLSIADLAGFNAVYHVSGVLSGSLSSLNSGSLTVVHLTAGTGSTVTGTWTMSSSVTFATMAISSGTFDISGASAATSLIFSSGTITGSVSAFAALTLLAGFSGTNFNCSGDLSSMTALVNLYAPTGSSTLTYPTSSGTRSWPAGMDRIYLRSQTLPTASIDALLIDLAAQSSWTGNKVVNLKGTRSSASDAAVATLTGYGVAVTVST